MAVIIKSFDRGEGVRTSTFNFDDLSTRADAYLAQVREQAAKILVEAQRQAEQIRRQAEIDGLRAAQKQMQTKVEAETSRRMESVLPALRTAVAEFSKAKHAWLTHWEGVGVGLATRIAGRVLRRELTNAPTLPLTLVRESLELAIAADGARLLMNPQDVEYLGPQVQMLVAEFGAAGRVEVVADPRVTAGGCRLETTHGSIDQQLETQLKRIEEELT
jgi:flagellar biosynthesis/type III secretory pathway protein FliH